MRVAEKHKKILAAVSFGFAGYHICLDIFLWTDVWDRDSF